MTNKPTQISQFTLRALLVAMLVVGAFLGGIELGTKREQQRLAAEREELKAAQAKVARDTSKVQQTADALGKLEHDAIKEHSRLARKLYERERRLRERTREAK